LQIVSKVQQQEIVSVEQQQVESSMKKQLVKQTPVVTDQNQKIFCHSCPTRTELISKEFFYTFSDGKAVFFCNIQEKNLWVGQYKLDK
jgi:hypothetical protein